MNRTKKPEPGCSPRNDLVEGNTTPGNTSTSAEDTRMIAHAQVQLLNLLANAVIDDLRRNGLQTTTSRVAQNENVRYGR